MNFKALIASSLLLVTTVLFADGLKPAPTTSVPQSSLATGAGRRLVFGQQPTATSSGFGISPSVTVQLQDDLGHNLTNNSIPVTLAILPATNNGALVYSTLTGNTVVGTVTGVATFVSLTPRTGTPQTYYLEAVAPGYQGAISAPFAITGSFAGTIDGSSVASLQASNVAPNSGVFPTGVLTAGNTNGAGHLLVVSGNYRYSTYDYSQLTNGNASALASGTVPPARLPSLPASIITNFVAQVQQAQTNAPTAGTNDISKFSLPGNNTATGINIFAGSTTNNGITVTNSGPSAATQVGYTDASTNDAVGNGGKYIARISSFQAAGGVTYNFVSSSDQSGQAGLWDTVFGEGWNYAPGGGQQIPSFPAFAKSHENAYIGDGGFKNFEDHTFVIDPTNHQWRVETASFCSTNPPLFSEHDWYNTLVFFGNSLTDHSSYWWKGNGTNLDFAGADTNATIFSTFHGPTIFADQGSVTAITIANGGILFGLGSGNAPLVVTATNNATAGGNILQVQRGIGTPRIILRDLGQTNEGNSIIAGNLICAAGSVQTITADTVSLSANTSGKTDFVQVNSAGNHGKFGCSNTDGAGAGDANTGDTFISYQANKQLAISPDDLNTTLLFFQRFGIVPDSSNNKFPYLGQSATRMGSGYFTNMDSLWFNGNGGGLTNLPVTAITGRTWVQTNFVLNTVYAAGTGSLFTTVAGTAAITLTAALAGTAELDLMYQPGGAGAYTAIAQPGTTITTLSIVMPYNFPFSQTFTNGNFYLTNSSTSAGASAALATGTGTRTTF